MVGRDTCCSEEKCGGDAPNLAAEVVWGAVAALLLFQGAPLHQELWPAPGQPQEKDVGGSCYAVEGHALWKQGEEVCVTDSECVQIVWVCSCGTQTAGTYRA